MGMEIAFHLPTQKCSGSRDPVDRSIQDCDARIINMTTLSLSFVTFCIHESIIPDPVFQGYPALHMYTESKGEKPVHHFVSFLYSVFW